MKAAFLCLFVAFLAGPAFADDFEQDLETATKKVAATQERIKAPGQSPDELARLRKQKAEEVKAVSSIADKRPENAGAQLAVGKSLASVEEAPRAIPYAERGLALAEKSGDPKLLRTALLTGSEVYYKAGKYELAGERAQRVLKDNPKDRDAMALYMQVKGRTSAPSDSKSGGSTSPAPASGGGNAAPPASAPKTAPAMTSASSLEARRHLDAGWSKLALDPAAALKRFDAAVAADAKNASVRVERAKARLRTGDATGAAEDAGFAVSLQPGLAEAYATRAEAGRALGKADAELLADYEQAAKLDGRFAGAYQSLLARSAAASGAPAAAGGGAGRSVFSGSAAPDGPRGMAPPAPPGRGSMALLALLALAAVVIVAVMRRSKEAGSQNR